LWCVCELGEFSPRGSRIKKDFRFNFNTNNLLVDAETKLFWIYWQSLSDQIGAFYCICPNITQVRNKIRPSPGTEQSVDILIHLSILQTLRNKHRNVLGAPTLLQ